LAFAVNAVHAGPPREGGARDCLTFPTAPGGDSRVPDI
jgi:hypothetical protein